MKKIKNELLGGISQLYPPFLVLMLLFVQVTAMYLNWQIYNRREILVFFFLIPLLMLPFLFFKKKFMYQLAVILLFFGSLVNLFHWLVVRGPVTSAYLFVSFNTNSAEAKEFLQMKLGWGLLLLIPYFVLFVLSLKHVPKTEKSLFKKCMFALFLCASLVFFAETVLNNRFVRKGLPQTTRAIHGLYEQIELNKLLKNREPMEVEAGLKTEDDKSRVFVLIIGESCNRNHQSIYGYEKPTTPLLGGREDIIVYSDVVSTCSHTIPSVQMMLTQANIENSIQEDKSVFINVEKSLSLIDVFRSAGFKTYWLSNQSPVGIWDNAISILVQNADFVSYKNLYGNTSQEALFYSPYDEVLFEPLKEVLSDEAKNKFVMLHLMGNHSSYEKRYPSNFDVFTSTTSSWIEKVRAQYDNSILYNDFVVDSILNILAAYQQQNDKAILSALYLSDHSENVYDENEGFGHDYAGTIPKANVEIPFIVWLSEQYRKSYEEKSKEILEFRNRPYVNGDLFHTVIDMNDVYTPCFEKDRSVFNRDFDLQRKRILVNLQDYDLQ